MSVLDTLRGGLVVSCQPVDDGPMDRPDIVAAMAAAAVAGGAAGLRIEGAANLAATRADVTVPIIGILKRDLTDSPVRITPYLADVAALAEAGADIIAYDATDRPRPETTAAILAAIRAAGKCAMADCSSLADGQRALAEGAGILGTTLSGYTDETAGRSDGMDLDLIRAFHALGGIRHGGRPGEHARTCGGGNGGRGGRGHRRHRTDAAGTCHRLVPERRRAGRPGPLMTDLSRSALTGFAADLGGTKIAAARIEGGAVARRLLAPTDPAADPEAQIRAISDLLDRLGHTDGAPLGVAVAGRVDGAGVWHAVNRGTLSAIRDFPLDRGLTRRLGVATCLNDAAAAAYAEGLFGAGSGSDSFAYLTVSTGVGGGLVIGKRLLASASGLAGHVGFVSSRYASGPCGSGRLATVESIAGGRGIAAAAAAAGHPGCDARAVFAAASEGQTWATRIVATSASAVAALIGDLTTILGLDTVAIGGSIGLAPGYIDRTRTALGDEPELFRPRITAAQLGHDGPLIGALAAHLRQEPSCWS